MFSVLTQPISGITLDKNREVIRVIHLFTLDIKVFESMCIGKGLSLQPYPDGYKRERGTNYTYIIFYYYIYYNIYNNKYFCLMNLRKYRCPK